MTCIALSKLTERPKDNGGEREGTPIRVELLSCVGSGPCRF